jgi:CBS domain-containing protein
MKVKEIMTPDVEIISPDITIQEAAAKMKELNVGILPVGENDKLIGMVTDRDITLRCTAEGKDPNSTYVKHAFTDHVKYVFEDASLEEASKVMEDNKIRRLIVLNRDKRAVGIISLGDMVVDGDQKIAAEALKTISKPSEPER